MPRALLSTVGRTRTAPRRRLRALRRRLRAPWRRLDPVRDERGAATAEYAIVIMAAVAFAGLLVVIMQSGEVQQILTDLVRRALDVDA